jgi:hypothetical protein
MKFEYHFKKCFCFLFALSLSMFVSAAADEPVFFNSACECNGNHAEYRWAVKTDSQAPPATIPATHRLRPSDIGNWPGPGGKFHKETVRAGKENEWFEDTGRVTLVKAEADGDFHVQLVDADGGSDVNIVVEVPLGDGWCDIRKAVMSWGKRQPPFTATHGNQLTLIKKPVVKVVGKAFYDAAHAGKNTAGNRRPVTKQAVTIWEIHPVMKLDVVSE